MTIKTKDKVSVSAEKATGKMLKDILALSEEAEKAIGAYGWQRFADIFKECGGYSKSQADALSIILLQYSETHERLLAMVKAFRFASVETTAALPAIKKLVESKS